MKQKLTNTLTLKQQLGDIINNLVSLLETMDHPDYNVLMRECDMEELLRLSRQAKKIIKKIS